jgi:hypothetical protein
VLMALWWWYLDACEHGLGQPFYRRTEGGGAGRKWTGGGTAGTRPWQGRGVTTASWLGPRESTAAWCVRVGRCGIWGVANRR